MDIKLFTRRNLLVFFAAYIPFGLISAFTNNTVAALIVIIAFGVAIDAMISIKKNPTEATAEKQLFKAIALMTLSPLVAQAVYFYGLKKTNAEVANAYNNLGWKVFGFEFLLLVLAFAAAVTLRLIMHG
jgi:hypothetical protein